MTLMAQRTDVVCLIVPEELDGATLLDNPATVFWLNEQAISSVVRMYGPHPGPEKLADFVFDWLVTNNRDEVDQFQPAHDCAQCRAGNDQARAFLATNPGRYLAMANIAYTEVWKLRG